MHKTIVWIQVCAQAIAPSLPVQNAGFTLEYLIKYTFMICSVSRYGTHTKAYKKYRYKKYKKCSLKNVQKAKAVNGMTSGISVSFRTLRNPGVTARLKPEVFLYAALYM